MRELVNAFWVSIAFTLLAGIGGANAEEIPEYDGVYLRLKDGSLAQLDPISFQNHTYVIRSGYECPPRAMMCLGQHLIGSIRGMRERGYSDLNRLKDNAGEMTMHIPVVFGISQIASDSHMPRSNPPVSVVIRGSNPEMTFVEDIVAIDDYIELLRAHPNGPSLVFPESFERDTRRLADAFVRNDWGCSASTFKVRRHDQFTTEYEADTCPLTYSQSAGPFDETSLKTIAHIIHSGGEYYVYMFP